MPYLRDNYKFTGDHPVTRPFLEPIEHLIPAKSELEKAPDLAHEIGLVRMLFWKGFDVVELKPHPWIDEELAMRHLRACYFNRTIPRPDKEKGMALLLKKFMASCNHILHNPTPAT